MSCFVLVQYIKNVAVFVHNFQTNNSQCITFRKYSIFSPNNTIYISNDYDNTEVLWASIIQQYKNHVLIFDDLDYCNPCIPKSLESVITNIQIRTNHPPVEILKLSTMRDAFPNSEASLYSKRGYISKNFYHELKQYGYQAWTLMEHHLNARSSILINYINTTAIPVAKEIVKLIPCRESDVLAGRRLKMYTKFVESDPELKKSIMKDADPSFNLTGGYHVSPSIGRHVLKPGKEQATIFDFSGVYPRIGSMVFKERCPLLANMFSKLITLREEFSASGNAPGALAMKLLANAIYGCLGSSRTIYSNRGLADLITTRCREAIKTLELSIIDLSPTKGVSILCGQTDSILVKHNTADLQYILDYIKEKVCNPFSLVVKIDAEFKKCVLIVDQNSYASIDRKTNKYYVKGLGNGPGTAPIVRRCFNEYVLKHVLVPDSSVDSEMILKDSRSRFNTALSPSKQIPAEELSFKSSSTDRIRTMKEIHNPTRVNSVMMIATENNRFVTVSEYQSHRTQQRVHNRKFYRDRMFVGLLDRVQRALDSKHRMFHKNRDRKTTELNELENKYFEIICSKGLEAFSEIICNQPVEESGQNKKAKNGI